MARRYVDWYVEGPYGREHFRSRKAARIYSREHGGARNGYKSNEYVYRKEYVRTRIALGFTDQALGKLEDAGRLDRDHQAMSRTMLAMYRNAMLADDLRAAREFSRGLDLVLAHAAGNISDEQYRDSMHDLYMFASQQGYVDEDSLEEQWRYPRG